MLINFATLLTSEQVVRIHEASLEVLENVGVLVRSEKARDCFHRHGCRVNSETLIVRFPQAVVEGLRKAFPPTFTFHGREALRQISSTLRQAGSAVRVPMTLPASPTSSTHCRATTSSPSPH
jgi:trimethylamine:corrinoid methyltransferase-like protein